MEPGLKASYRWNERLAALVDHLIVGLMMACFAISIAQFAQRLVPGWDGWYLAPLCFLVAVEAMYTKRALGRIAFPSREWIVYRGAEWVAILALVRLLLYGLRGFDQFWTDIQGWREGIYRTFASVEFLFVGLVVIIIWGASTYFAEDLAEMEGDVSIVDHQSLGYELMDRSLARRLLLNRTFLIGIAMVVLTALVRADLGLLWGERPQVQAAGYNVLLYFLLGLALFSLSQFSILRANWFWERIPVSRDMAKGWVIYALSFLLVVVLTVSFLPTRYSLGLLDLIYILIQFIYLLTFSLINLIVYLLTALYALLIPTAGRLDQPEPPSFNRNPGIESPVPGGLSVPWLEVIRSLFFWAFFLLIVGFSLYSYLQQHSGLIRKIDRLPGFSWLARLLGRWKSLFRAWDGKIVQHIRARWERLPFLASRRAKRPPVRFFNPRRLSPRQRVIFFYLAMVREGRKSGVPRLAAQTPYEYEETLRAALPQLESEAEGITEAFMQARYSLHPLTDRDAGAVRQLWVRIRRALRARRRSP